MIKSVIVFVVLWVSMPMILSARKPSDVHIKKVEVGKNENYAIKNVDSSLVVEIDTLVMSDKASLEFVGVKRANLMVKHARIGKNCVIKGDDGKNNGTNLIFCVNIESLGGLLINVPGLDAKMSNRKVRNGDGGDVEIRYLLSGMKPQFENKKQAGYVEIKNNGGGYLTTPQSDLYSVFSLMRSGSPGRPLGLLTNGVVYSGNVGKNGRTKFLGVEKLVAIPDSKASSVRPSH